jgi:hypothetical protein
MTKLTVAFCANKGFEISHVGPVGSKDYVPFLTRIFLFRKILGKLRQEYGIKLRVYAHITQ